MKTYRELAAEVRDKIEHPRIVTDSELQAFIRARQVEIDGMYDVFSRHLQTAFEDMGTPPYEKITWRMKLRIRWCALTYRVASVFVWAARKINSNAVPTEDYER